MHIATSAFERRRQREEPSDFTSQEGGAILKQRIEAYWAARGANVMVSLSVAPFHPTLRAARYDVRSDMVNGLPRSGAAPVLKPTEDLFVDDFGDDEWEANEAAYPARRAG